MAFKSILLALLASTAVNAHFKLAYPEWRADTLAEENEDKYSQWNNPCTSPPLQNAKKPMTSLQQTLKHILLTESQAAASPTKQATSPTGPSAAAPSPSSSITPGPTSMSTSASAQTPQTSTSPSRQSSSTSPAAAPFASRSSPFRWTTSRTARLRRCRSSPAASLATRSTTVLTFDSQRMRRS